MFSVVASPKIRAKGRPEAGVFFFFSVQQQRPVNAQAQIWHFTPKVAGAVGLRRSAGKGWPRPAGVVRVDGGSLQCKAVLDRQWLVANGGAIFAVKAGCND